MKKNRTITFSKSVSLILLLTFAVSSSISAQKLPALKDAYKNYFVIGSALNEPQTTGKDSLGAAIAASQYNTITPENCLKWERVHPQADKYTFEMGDSYVSWGEKNNMFIIGHCLVWHSQTPRWVFQDAEGKPATRDLLLQRMKEHISTVAGHYKGRIKGWDVVNEALNEDGTMRQSQWYKIIGDDFIVKAFQFAHEADPDAELYYNDYNIENPEKLKGAVAIVKKLKENGCKITGVGIQGHWRIQDPALSVIENAIKEFAALGVKVMFTELDINVLPTPYNGLSADIALRADYQEKYNPYVKGLPDSVEAKLGAWYKDLFTLFVKEKEHVSRVTFWGVTDKESWLNGWPIRGRTNYPLLFNRDGSPKKAFYDVLSVVK